MAAVHHVFTFDDPYRAKRFVIRICDDIKRNTLVPVMIFRDGVTVHVLDGDGQTLRLLALSKESSASGMRAIKVPYPSDGST